jgi:hypothetical protein
MKISAGRLSTVPTITSPAWQPSLIFISPVWVEESIWKLQADGSNCTRGELSSLVGNIHRSSGDVSSSCNVLTFRRKGVNNECYWRYAENCAWTVAQSGLARRKHLQVSQSITTIMLWELLSISFHIRTTDTTNGSVTHTHSSHTLFARVWWSLGGAPFYRFKTSTWSGGEVFCWLQRFCMVNRRHQWLLIWIDRPSNSCIEASV